MGFSSQPSTTGDNNMRNTISIARATLAFAITLTLSCSGDDPLPDGGGSSSSIADGGSSSSGGGNGTGGIIPGEPVTYENETYETVVIGTQTWMARNLNYNATGSVCYNNLESNCETYGKLYDWATAMTACPSGWHLPTNAETRTLIDYIKTQKSCCAGKYLKATSGWNGEGNGTDEYGFTALPGGCYQFSSFREVGKVAEWWTASKDGQDFALRWGLDYNSDGNHSGNVPDDIISGSTLLSVRCIKDN
jgi:uncharacterized protein (TIGR02145 family)